jgi:hypothetical protein
VAGLWDWEGGVGGSSTEEAGAIFGPIQFGAWLGLGLAGRSERGRSLLRQAWPVLRTGQVRAQPSQNSSGGKASLGRITKRGDEYLRTLLIQGAKSAVMTAHKRSDRISQWLVQLLARVGWQKAVVALANKNARILWAVLARGRTFDPNHVSVKPGAIIGAVAAAA